MNPMNTTISSKDVLAFAKRNLEKMVDRAQAHVLDTYRNDARFTVSGYLSGPLDDFRYFHPDANKKPTFEKHAHKINDQLDGFNIEDAALNSMISSIRTQYDLVIKLAADEKARLAQKRQTLKAKADLKAELNLQEGVKLAGVDVGQYKVILSGLEPVRLHVRRALLKALNNEFSALDAALAKVEYKVEGFNEYPRNGSRADVAEWERVSSRLRRWFTHQNGIVYRKHYDAGLYMIDEADARSLAYIQGYAVKLAGKVGEVIVAEGWAGMAPVLCWTASSTLWEDSTAFIKLQDASKAEVIVTFHTQIIWNTSCLGKHFNQWPTRRVL